MLLILLFGSLNPTFGNDIYSEADSIMLKVLNNRDIYEDYIEEYEAEVYIRGNNHVEKKNILYRYAPSFLYVDRKGGNDLAEALVSIHFRSPNHFTQQIKAINGPKIYFSDIEERVTQFLNVNVYNPTLFNDLVILPGEDNIFRYYKFEYAERTDTLGHPVHKIRCTPKIKSQKLMTGYIYVLGGSWAILELDAWGKLDFFRYRIKTKFGLPGESDFLLPKENRITFNMHLLGNETVNHYYSTYKYSYINKRKEEKDPPETGYDLSKYFNVQTDSLPYVTEEKFWEENRTIPLTPYELDLLEKRENQGKDTTGRWGEVILDHAQKIFSPKKVLSNNSTFSYSGLVNPLELSYSKRDGFIYWQELRFRHIQENGQEVRFSPSVGFLFKHKDIYFNVPAKWLFQPARFGELNFNFGNKNHNYAYRTQQLIEDEIPDSLDFEDFGLKYFRHYNVSLDARYEICNGLILETGVDYSWYTPVKSKKLDDMQFRSSVEEDIIDIVDDRYRTFSPHASITWTPGQYYRFIGKQKQYVRSAFPTFSAQYARGIRGILDSNSDYEQLEVDIQQKIPLGLMRSFQYYIGAGRFTNTKSFYFADFSRFQKRNFPQSWEDPIGGVFHLLDGKWYTASDSYAQAHFMYESPFILLHLFRRVSRDILKERFYFSQLYTPELPSYTEFGYGIGNFIGNIGIFVSMEKGKFDSIGAKFSFELGK